MGGHEMQDVSGLHERYIAERKASVRNVEVKASGRCDYGCGLPLDRLGQHIELTLGDGRVLTFCCVLHESFWLDEHRKALVVSTKSVGAQE
jgi:hypothetical protein